MTARPIPADVAAWIRDTVIPVSYRRNTTDPAKCACQWGACGHCKAGRHRDCTTTAWGWSPSPDTYLCGARVWRSGRPCRWICPCITCRSVSFTPIQLDLFAGVNQ